MPIKAVINIFESKHDIYGNSYCAATFTNQYGDVIKAHISGNHSNVEYAMRELFASEVDKGTYYNEVIFSYHYDYPIREFNRLTKTWKYAGCTSKEINTFLYDMGFMP